MTGRSVERMVLVSSSSSQQKKPREIPLGFQRLNVLLRPGGAGRTRFKYSSFRVLNRSLDGLGHILLRRSNDALELLVDGLGL